MERTRVVGRLSLLLSLALAASGCLLPLSPDQIGKAREDCTVSLAVHLPPNDTHVSEDLLVCWLAGLVKGCADFEMAPDNLDPDNFYDCKLQSCDPKACGKATNSSVSWAAFETASPPEPIRLWSAATVPAAERAALLAFYNATGGSTSWYSWQKTNWLGAPGTECTWTGVGCDPSGAHVTSLEVFTTNLAINLVGELPKEIGDLSELLVLRIHGAQGLTGPLPAEIGKLKKLRLLSLSQTKLSGSLPAALGGLSALETLNIGSADISGPIPSALGTLSQLQGLRLSATRVSGPIPASLGSLSQLRTLDLRLNELSGAIPASLANLANLEGLFLGWNDFSGPIPSALASLTKLQNLNLEHNRLSGLLPALGNLTNLETLTLDANELTGALPDVAGLQKLRNLSIGFNALTGTLSASLANLAALEILYLPDNQFSGPLPDLSALANLTDLHLSWNNFDLGPVPAWLAAPALGKLSKLDLSHANRTGSFPNLSSLPLTHLAIGENGFDHGPVPDWIGAEATLVHLDLRNCGRTGEIPAFLAQLDELRTLILSDNLFTPGPIPPFFVNTEMGLLSSLTLDNTQRSGSIPKSVFTLSLSTLRLARNQLTGPIPPDVSKPLIKILDLSHNQLGGALPQELGTQVRMQSLRLNGNKFTGEIPAFFKSSMIDEDMIDGTVSDDFGREFPGLDLRHNALTTSDPEMVALAKQKHEGGVDFQATQTVAPTNLKATATGKSSIKLTWTPIAFSSGPGGYTVEMGTKAKGPFSVLGTSANKTVSTATITGLKANTQYYFRVKTTSGPSPENANVLVSVATKAAKAKTKK